MTISKADCSLSLEKIARFILPLFCPWICYVVGFLFACLRFCKAVTQRFSPERRCAATLIKDAKN